MNRIRIHTLAGTLVLAFLTTTVSAELRTPDAKYRVLDAYGVGNCIFSNTALPFEKEDAYTGLGTEFSTDNRPEEIRCYFGARVIDYQGKGAFWNSIRDEYNYFNYLTVEEPNGGDTFYERLGSYTPDGDTANWDQMRMGIKPGKGSVNCNFKEDDDLGTEGCMDLDKQVRALAASKGADLPYTAEVCISFYFSATDHFEEQWHEHSGTWRKQRSGVANHYMAGPNCINYTATGTGPAVRPGKQGAPTKKKGPPPFKLPF